MPVMVKMRPTEAMPPKLRQRYMTRRLVAGDVFEASPNEVRLFMKAKWADIASDEPAPVAKRRGRPPKVAAPEPEPFEDKTVPELREMAEERGVDLPSGYVRKEELVERISEADDDDNTAA